MLNRDDRYWSTLRNNHVHIFHNAVEWGSSLRSIRRWAEISYNIDRRCIFTSVFALVMHVDTMDLLPSVIRFLPRIGVNILSLNEGRSYLLVCLRTSQERCQHESEISVRRWIKYPIAEIFSLRDGSDSGLFMIVPQSSLKRTFHGITGHEIAYI